MQSEIEQKSEERRERTLQIQKKTFTNYINSILLQADLKVEDLFEDLRSGVTLLRLLELVSGRQLPPSCRGNLRVHHLENINMCLEFLNGLKVHVESISAAAIVDGIPHLTLGLVWTIILRFHIQDAKKQGQHSSEKSLLLWCQRRTSCYENVTISNFSDSWSSGLAFNALIHSQDEDLFTFSELLGRSHLDNLNHAFEIAEEHFNIPRLLDAEDVDAGIQDEKSIIAYVASYHNAFEKSAKQRGEKEDQSSQLDGATADQRKKEQELYREELNQQRQEAERIDQLIIQQREEALYQQALKRVLFYCVLILFISLCIINHGYFSNIYSLVF